MSSTLLTFGELKILQKKFYVGPELSNGCRLDYWLISNSLYDSVTGTDIIPAIKTGHSAILLEFCNNVNEIKGPGYILENELLPFRR